MAGQLLVLGLVGSDPGLARVRCQWPASQQKEPPERFVLPPQPAR
jgi:hypothetical protein